MDKELECYKKMYAYLCFAAYQAIDLLEEPENIPSVRGILQDALRKAEEKYISDSVKNFV